MIDALKLPRFNKPGAFPPEIRASTINNAIRDQLSCPGCGQLLCECDERAMTVHHRIFRYWSQQLNIPQHMVTDPVNAIALHRDCHDSFHNDFTDYPPYNQQGYEGFNIKPIFDTFGFAYLQFIHDSLEKVQNKFERQVLMNLIQPELIAEYSNS